MTFTPDSRFLIASNWVAKDGGAAVEGDDRSGPGRHGLDDLGLGAVLAVSPDGKLLATGTDDGAIRAVGPGDGQGGRRGLDVCAAGWRWASTKDGKGARPSPRTARCGRGTRRAARRCATPQCQRRGNYDRQDLRGTRRRRGALRGRHIFAVRGESARLGRGRRRNSPPRRSARCSPACRRGGAEVVDENPCAGWARAIPEPTPCRARRGWRSTAGSRVFRRRQAAGDGAVDNARAGAVPPRPAAKCRPSRATPASRAYDLGGRGELSSWRLIEKGNLPSGGRAGQNPAVNSVRR